MSKKIWLEWIIPICNYFETLNNNERNFEIRLPFICGIIASFICFYFNLEQGSVNKLNELLPNVLAILIGFTISAISIIATSQ